MNTELQQKMEHAWSYLWDGLFCEETHLFYDYRTSLERAHRFDHLPHLDEIKQQFPNPCGWGTGMEDSMLNVGSAMDILRLRKQSGDESALPAALKVLQGMTLCTRVHKVEGFVARSVSPIDRQSCYFNSSRDQFTLCVYGAWRFLRGFPEAPTATRTEAKDLLIRVARYCERVIHETNDNLLRLDGKPAAVSTMVHVQAHEVLRLPMIYAAAWDATGDEHWHELYRLYALQGINKNLTISDLNWNWNDWELAQMQLSLELLRTVEVEPSLKQKYGRAMGYTAQLAERLMNAVLKRAADFHGDWRAVNSFWRTAPMKVRDELLTSPSHTALYGGYAYMMPQQPDAYHQPYSILRALGNLTCAMLLCESYVPSSEILAQIATVVSKPDYEKHCSDGPINILHGFWIGRNRRMW